MRAPGLIGSSSANAECLGATKASEKVCCYLLSFADALFVSVSGATKLPVGIPKNDYQHSRPCHGTELPTGSCIPRTAWLSQQKSDFGPERRPRSDADPEAVSAISPSGSTGLNISRMSSSPIFVRRDGLPLGFPNTPLGHGRPLRPCFLLGISDT